MIRSFRVVLPALFVAVTAASCGAPIQHTPDSATLAVKVPTDVKTGFSFERITPTGEKIFKQGLVWMNEQEFNPSFPQKAQCANNLSQVLEMSGINSYSSPLLDVMVSKVRNRGGLIVDLPKSKAGVISSLNATFDGKLPVGTFVSGCLNKDCSGQSGDGHIGYVGDTDAQGNVSLYHNNWYRPDNNGGIWVPNMVSKRFYYDLGFVRQWMSTPWLKLKKDSSGKIVDVVSLLPAIDDLDPFQYFVRLSVMPEIIKEIKDGKSLSTDGNGAVRPVSTGGVVSKLTCTVKSSDGSMNVRSTPNGSLLFPLSNGAVVISVGKNGAWHSVEFKRPGTSEDFGAKFGKSAFIHESGLVCK